MLLHKKILHLKHTIYRIMTKPEIVTKISVSEFDKKAIHKFERRVSVVNKKILSMKTIIKNLIIKRRTASEKEIVVINLKIKTLKKKIVNLKIVVKSLNIKIMNLNTSTVKHVKRIVVIKLIRARKELTIKIKNLEISKEKITKKLVILVKKIEEKQKEMKPVVIEI